MVHLRVNFAPPPTPAFAKTASSLPWVATASAIPSTTACSSETSTFIAVTRPPCRRSFSAAAAFFASRCPQMITSPPAWEMPSARPVAIARISTRHRARPCRSNRKGEMSSSHSPIAARKSVRSDPAHRSNVFGVSSLDTLTCLRWACQPTGRYYMSQATPGNGPGRGPNI